MERSANRSEFHFDKTAKNGRNSLAKIILISSFIAFASCSGGSSGGGSGGGTTGVAAGTVTLTGTVNGGSSAIVGSNVTIYVTSSSGGQATSLGGPVTTNGSGGFSIKYTPPKGVGLLYVIASGGNAGGGTNSAISLMSFIGSAGSATTNNSVTVNELSTVVSAYELETAGLTQSGTNISGTSSQLTTAINSLEQAFSISSGTIPASSTLTTTYQTDLTSIAGGVEACVQSAGSTSSACTIVFNDGNTTTTSGTSDTLSGIVSDFTQSSGSPATLATTVSGTYTPPTTITTGSLILATTTATAGGAITVSTLPYNTQTGAILNSGSPTSQISIPNGTSVNSGGGSGFDSSYSIYSILENTSTGATLNLYSFTPATGFGALLSSQSVSGSNCGGGIDALFHVAFIGCKPSGQTTGLNISAYSYNSSGSLSPTNAYNFPSVIQTAQNITSGPGVLNSFFLWYGTQPSTASTALSIAGDVPVSPSGTGANNSFSTPISIVNYPFGYDAVNGLIFATPGCYNSSCPSPNPFSLYVYQYNNSTGTISSSPLASAFNGGDGYSINGASSNINQQGIDPVDQEFFSYNPNSSALAAFGYTDSSGLVTIIPQNSITLTALNSNGNSFPILDPTDHFVFIATPASGGNSLIGGITVAPYNNTGLLSSVETSSPISLGNNNAVVTCSGSNCNTPDLLFDVVP